MATNAQITANQINSQSSTGPRTEEGKQTSSQNNFRHGLASSQILIPGENRAEFEAMREGFMADQKPTNMIEAALVNNMATHYWLAQRAIRLQTSAFDDGVVDEKKLALYLRYQTTHDRAFHKCLSDLLKLRAERRREQIGFESQNQKEALNEAKIRNLNSRAEANEIDTEIRTAIEAPLPGHTRIPFDAVRQVIVSAVREAAEESTLEAAN
jgi:hypothetical protein